MFVAVLFVIVGTSLKLALAQHYLMLGLAGIPKEVVIEDKTVIEQMQLLQQLDEEDRSTVFKIIDKMLTTKKFKDFFNKNVAML